LGEKVLASDDESCGGKARRQIEKSVGEEEKKNRANFVQSPGSNHSEKGGGASSFTTEVQRGKVNLEEA